MDSLGQRIAYYRKKANLRQKDLAAAVGLSPSVLNNYEKDKRQPTAVILSKLAEALNITGDALLGLDHPDLVAQNKNEFQTLHGLRKLNRLGQKKVLEYISDLSESSKYTEKE
jgi:transcriptional regulator with XRE-family HTH domain